MRTGKHGAHGAPYRLKPGGLFACSLEAGDDVNSYVLRSSGRYAHALDYVRGLADRVGLCETCIDEVVLRMDRQTPIDGYICVFGKPGAVANAG
jgi:predicted TPR repeat methyltransferase